MKQLCGSRTGIIRQSIETQNFIMTSIHGIVMFVELTWADMLK